MKLYSCPRYSIIKVIDVNVKTPPSSYGVDKDDELYFDHVDGMYSYCETKSGNIVHIAAWTEVEFVREGKNWS